MTNQLTPEQQQAVARRVAAMHRSARRSMWIGLIVFFICAGAFWYFVSSAFNAANPQADPNSTPIVVTTAQITEAYADNQVSADQTYKGNLIEVSGAVSSIGKDLFNNPYVTLASTNPSDAYQVQCSFDQSQEDALANLVKGENITLEGTGNGLAIVNVELTHCSIVPNASSTN
jgi:hypothetical protein